MKAMGMSIDKTLFKDVRAAGLTPLFMGSFRQGVTDSDEALGSPIIIGLTPEQAAEYRLSGKLVGRMFGYDGVADVDGHADRQKINFIKRRDDAVIRYEGAGSSRMYNGRWVITSPVDGTLDREGRFSLADIMTED